MPGAKRWQGERPEVCEVCDEKLEKTFVDGKLLAGPWAIMCDDCHRVIGVGIGTGRGQRYDRKTLKKIEG